MSSASQIVTINNEAASVSVDLNGGAIVDFHLHEDDSLVHSFTGSLVPNAGDGLGINPLTFKREGVNFQGHFLCLGRWGAPSAGEQSAGIVTHGEAVTQVWERQTSTQKNEILMGAVAPLEGLRIEREMVLDAEGAVFLVKEAVTNINPLGRLFNLVQHPTIGAPFLTSDTIVNCNADRGFNYMLNKRPLENAAGWPLGIMEDGGKMNVSKPDKAYSSVFSFTVKKDAKFGWITAYNPKYNLLIGYLWNRDDYPWISLWQDFDGDNIRYRGLEFGTTGMHKSYKEIIAESNHRVFDEDNYKYIDAGETQSRSYLSFMTKAPVGFDEVANVDLKNNELTVTGAQGKQIRIQTTLKANGISK